MHGSMTNNLMGGHRRAAASGGGVCAREAAASVLTAAPMRPPRELSYISGVCRRRTGPRQRASELLLPLQTLCGAPASEQQRC